MFDGTADLIRAALVATKVGNEVKEIIGASKSLIKPNGPSIEINGSLGNTTEPSN